MTHDKTELLLIRHGETAWNALRKLQGHIDIGLNPTGLKQAQALAQALANLSLDAIISSDLQRASLTAQAIAQVKNLPIQIDRNLRERCFGAFQGKLYSEIESLYPSQYALWQSRDPDYRLPADENGIFGESIREFQQRCASTILHYARQYPGKKLPSSRMVEFSNVPIVQPDNCH